VIQLTLTQPSTEAFVTTTFEQLGPAAFALGWLLVVSLILWTAWEAYKILKMIDYVSSVQWTFLQITLPVDSEETPKSMEVAYDVLGGIHKSPDLNELYFDGYHEAWYSCELHCSPGRTRYIMVVPTASRQLFEGVIYGQYPRAAIKEVEDYTLRYNWQDIRKKFDIYGAEIVFNQEDFYPIKTYREYETSLAENDRYVDPHQAMVEAFTNTSPGEEFWVQVVIRPMDPQMDELREVGEQEVAKISGQAGEEKPSLGRQIMDFFLNLPGEVLATIFTGPREAAAEKPEFKLRFFNPVDEAKMKGILQKISQNNFKTIIRVVHIAPPGQLKKPNIGRAIGAFKQFNTQHLNSLKPSDTSKTNGPNYILRESRRKYRERYILLKFQWRDMFGRRAGQWLSAEELATIYHFPVKYVRTPGLERAKAGVQSPPANIPYA
jgi:hypothetical protein